MFAHTKVLTTAFAMMIMPVVATASESHIRVNDGLWGAPEMATLLTSCDDVYKATDKTWKWLSTNRPIGAPAGYMVLGPIGDAKLVVPSECVHVRKKG